ncbi:MAG TPA: hypothetical protein VI653_10175 [Steroidobacteraceae bacterium]
MPTPARHTQGLADTAPVADNTARRPRSAYPDLIDPGLRPAILPPDAMPAQKPVPPAVAKEPQRSAPPAQQARKKKWLTTTSAFATVVTALLILGWRVPTERYITPTRGLGYALGIIGGSLMLLLFLYSARKRIPWLKFMGPAAGWFRYHMVLGVLGPLCILYHSNFGLGATNSNIALFSMLTVAGSGLIGRYIYARIHHGLYGSKLSLGVLRKGAESLRSGSSAFTFLPQLVERLESAERALLTSTGKVPLLGIARLIGTAMAAMMARLRLHSYVRQCLREAAAQSPTIAAQRKRLRSAAFAYIDRRLAATRRVAGFEAYERLFSLWHALHLPLIFLMLVAGIVHVIAVHVY